MVDLPVLGLICANVKKQIAHGSVTLWHPPVVDGDLGHLQLLPLRDETSVDILDLTGVGNDSFLLEKTDESVDGPGAQEVREEQCIAPNALNTVSLYPT